MEKLARELTKKIKIGKITIGGSSKVLIQSMCNIKTSIYKEVAKQINECARFGADLMRVSVLDFDDAKAIKEIKKLINIPLIADIHFDYRLAIEAINSGVDAVRLNPGNIGSKENIKKVVELCKEKHIPIRIGVNSGSIDKEVNNNTAIVNAKELVESASRMAKILEDLGFYDIVISLVVLLSLTPMMTKGNSRAELIIDTFTAYIILFDFLHLSLFRFHSQRTRKHNND